MAERITIRLPDDLVRRAKHKAAAEGRTLTGLIEDGLRRVLGELLPAHKGGPGLAAGEQGERRVEARIDLSATADLQEMEDLDARLPEPTGGNRRFGRLR